MSGSRAALLLDLDGPLLDPRPALHRALQMALDSYVAISSPPLHRALLDRVLDRCDGFQRGWLCAHLLRWAASGAEPAAWTHRPAPVAPETVDDALARALVDSAYLGSRLHAALRPGRLLGSVTPEGSWHLTRALVTREELMTFAASWRLALLSDRSPGETVHTLAHHGWLGCFEAVGAANEHAHRGEERTSSRLDHVVACLGLRPVDMTAITTQPARATALQRAGVNVIGLATATADQEDPGWPTGVRVIAQWSQLGRLSP